MNKIIIYTDGGCRNPGKDENIGAYAATLEYKGNIKEIYAPQRNTTNNEMEMKAVVVALQALKRVDIPVEIHSDSAYVVNCINDKWYKKWMANGWVTSKKEQVKNRDLWIEMLDEIEKFRFVKLLKVKGHSGNPGNERVDKLCNIAMDQLKEI